MSAGNGTNGNTAGQNVATVEWGGTPQCVSASARAEIERDIRVFVNIDSTSDIWSEATEPTDKTLIWWPRDAITGLRVGKPKTYNSASGQWEELGKAEPVTYPVPVFGNDTVAASVSQSKTVTFPSPMANAEYHFDLTPTTRVGSTFGAASTNMNDFGWQITAMTPAAVTLQFFNVPTGGLGFSWIVTPKQ